MFDTKKETLLKNIVVLDDKRVVLDCDIADFLETTPSEISQMVKENAQRFTQNDIVKVDNDLWQKYLAKIDRFSRTPKELLPTFAFTDNGVLVLATILKTNRAHLVTQLLVQTYQSVADLRHIFKQLAGTTNEAVQRKLLDKSGEILNDLFGATTLDGQAVAAFQLRERQPNQPVSATEFYRLMEENGQLRRALAMAQRQLREWNKLFGRMGGACN